MMNPYSLSFGKLPEHLILRPQQTNMIFEDFSVEHSSSQAYMITGV